ncbi:MAG: hypothetical protein KTR26_07530 [Flammeovirgaceae bacterium]|nr:hypothetical protein [Flammeovirgaceae bacterium]
MNIVNFIRICMLCLGLLISCHSKQDNLYLFDYILNDYEFPENCKILDETINYNELNLSIELEELTKLKLENDYFDLKYLLKQKKENIQKLNSNGNLDFKFDLISEDKFPEIWRTDTSFKGLIRVGRPFYSKNAKYAYLECFYVCRGDCGFQVGVIYKMEKNGWMKWKEMFYSIS